MDGGAAVINGDLTLSPGSALIAAFALNNSSLTVNGNINVQNGATLIMGCSPTDFPCLDDPNQNAPTLTGSTRVFGSINSLQPLGVIVHASTITRNVNVLGGGGGVNCNPSGIFNEFGSPVFSAIEDNSIGGNLSIIELQSCWYGVIRNNVQGNVININNAMADPDANEVHSNKVHKNMICFNNNPKVQFGEVGGLSNQVGGMAVGECGFDVKLPDPTPNGALTPISVKLN